MIEVIGGCYHETCLAPPVHQFYGSGGRAAAMLASAGHDVQLHTFVAPETKNAMRRLAALSGFDFLPYRSSSQVGFAYVNPLFAPSMHPNTCGVEIIAIDTEAPVLAFGMVEGHAKIRSPMVVFDPQGSQDSRGFRSKGSECARLCIICNERELGVWVPGDIGSSARKLLEEECAEAIVVKRGAKGVSVYTRDAQEDLPAFRTPYDGVFSIGSGDTFAASFVSEWAIKGRSPIAAALAASRSVAWYVSTRSEKPPTDQQIANMSEAIFRPGRVYLAGPFFNMAQRWLIEQTRAVFLDMGLGVFSPLHEVGVSDANTIARRDLEGLQSCDRLFGVLDGCDPGTVFEVGFARKLNMPCYLYAETVGEQNSTMLAGSGCKIIDDYCTAMHNTAWMV